VTIACRAAYVTACMATLVAVAAGCRAPRSSSLAPAALHADSARIVVSRRELRVEFPVERARAWGWPVDTARPLAVLHEWRVWVSSPDGPVGIGMQTVRRDSAAQYFASLDDVVRAGELVRCRGGMFVTCEPQRGLSAHVAGGRVVVVLRDRATVDSLFGLRPASVRVQHRSADTPYAPTWTALVSYVAPQIPAPTPALLAEGARRRRAYEASIRRVRRRIVGGEGLRDVAASGTTLWLEAGDSVPLFVEEERCTEDVCGGSRGDVRDSGWTIADAAIAELREFTDRSPPLRRVLGVASLVARRPGRTTLRVRGLHGDADTMPSRQPPPRELAAEVVVIPRVGRIEIEPHADTAVAGRVLRVGVRLYDLDGRLLERVPVEVQVEGGPTYAGSNPVDVYASTPGRHRVVARFRRLGDTSAVTIVP